MKKYLFMAVLAVTNIAFAQIPCNDFCLDFDDTICLKNVTIDTITYENNIWQIGKPQKPSFDVALFNTQPIAIITDTINSYPINNVSVFTINPIASMGDYYGMTILSGYYNVQTDSLKDYGTIEFSPDKGETWIDIINDSIYSSNIQWWSGTPVLTGNSNGWIQFEAMMADLGSIFNFHIGDTLLYRFSFMSDSIYDNLGGLMFDNICFWEFVEGVTETRFKPLKSTIYPNPSNSILTIKFQNPDKGIFNLSVYDEQSNLKISKNNITGNEISINSEMLIPGVYFYKLTNPKTVQRSWGKFIVTK
ncbi:MAG: T9SS type A sorting domain-containing protein [Chlorobi bacterium]|nr:T9SS type A sorting domain-containing protein [Chlorobiota bacterium]